MTKDLATVGRLGVHAEGSVITARYAKGANAEVDVAAVAAFERALAIQRRSALKATPAEDSRTARPVHARKRRTRRDLRDVG